LTFAGLDPRLREDKRVAGRPRATLLSLLDRVGLAAALLTPLFLMHGHGIAEATMGATSACFLARCAVTKDWAWLRAGWVPLGLAWWAWLVVCSLPFPTRGLGEGGVASTVQAIAVLRFLLFAAALEHGALRDPAGRRWMYRVLAACTAYIALHAVVQFFTGHNLYGDGKGIAGELTGPFNKPRAGPPLARILLPVVIPPAALLLSRRRPASTVAAYALLLLSTILMVLISQRMPAVLTAFGLAVSALLLRRLRPVVLAALLAGCALVAVSAVVSPPTWQRLVLEFSTQLENFGSSHYGFLYERSAAMAEQHPWTGRGYDGFRSGCPLPRYGETALEQARVHFAVSDVCAPHPHNFYLQAVTDAGFPGLALFCALALTWIGSLGRGLWRNPAPLRVGLFASVLIQLWPIASTSSFFSMPMGGWFFLLLGWGLAESRAHAQSQEETSRTEATAPS
jgi:O-antigen ligase